ncbi:hypothetical protein [Colwellia psychrerythraea]|uniref:Lipoprotein n=1 Tax=Colwellia psychrerythraea TaxID=28229 RepID=A0A099KD43_COLPS|nr:hypothetical protein [Colwellia psychrerythraea]KGJ88619.1 hypothetical protein ND2E_3917 [Colwellia psychrerythraea]
MRFFSWFVYNKSNYNRNKKSIFVAVTLGLVSSLAACSNIEKMRSDSLFEQYCNEEGRVGQFIYERVALGEEFFRSIPTDIRELDRIENSFYIDNKKLLIDKESFMDSYTINYLKRTELSSVGPIYSVESTLVRKSDGKVLSKAVSLLNKRGKTSKIFPVQGVYCQTGRDNKGNHLSTKHHFDLVENTFFKK